MNRALEASERGIRRRRENHDAGIRGRGHDVVLVAEIPRAELGRAPDLDGRFAVEVGRLDEGDVVVVGRREHDRVGADLLAVLVEADVAALHVGRRQAHPVAVAQDLDLDRVGLLVRLVALVVLVAVLEAGDEQDEDDGEEGRGGAEGGDARDEGEDADEEDEDVGGLLVLLLEEERKEGEERVFRRLNSIVGVFEIFIFFVVVDEHPHFPGNVII